MVTLSVPRPSELGHLGETLGAWQRDNAPVQLHPGDVGWYSGKGIEATASALRVWAAGDGPLAIGLLDGPEVLRLAFAPQAHNDHELARRIASDVDMPERGVFPEGFAAVEARGAHALCAALGERGWEPDEPWTPLRLDFARPRRETTILIERVTADEAEDWAVTHWMAFRNEAPSDNERQQVLLRWHTMVSGPFGQMCQSLLARDELGAPVAVAAVWSAGVGRPGLLEPIGVHPDQRGTGYGKAIIAAAVNALRDSGASSALVCTESARTTAVASYVASGFSAEPEVRDMARKR